MNYLMHLLVMVNIYIILSLSLNLLVGYSGLLSLCHAAFFGIGAYLHTLMLMKLGLDYWVALLITIMGASVLSIFVSIPSLRFRNDYFVLASLGFQVIVYSILYNWISVTRGPYGIPGFPRPVILGHELSNTGAYLLFSGVLMSIVFVVIWALASSPFGRALKAIREDEVAALSLGKNIAWFKIITFALASGIASIAGVLFAGYMSFIDPTSFDIGETILLLTMVIVGGSGNIKGPIIGTLVILLVPEALRFLQLSDAIAANMREIIYGSLIILLMRFRPQGIAGEYRFL